MRWPASRQLCLLLELFYWQWPKQWAGKTLNWFKSLGNNWLLCWTAWINLFHIRYSYTDGPYNPLFHGAPVHCVFWNIPEAALYSTSAENLHLAHSQRKPGQAAHKQMEPRWKSDTGAAKTMFWATWQYGGTRWCTPLSCKCKKVVLRLLWF